MQNDEITIIASGIGLLGGMSCVRISRFAFEKLLTEKLTNSYAKLTFSG